MTNRDEQDERDQSRVSIAYPVLIFVGDGVEFDGAVGIACPPRAGGTAEEWSCDKVGDGE